MYCHHVKLHDFFRKIRRFFKRTFSRKFRIQEDCWDLDFAFYQWLNEHLKVFKEDASKFIDMQYHKFTYHSETYDLEQMIDKMIFLTEALLSPNIYLSYEEESEYIKNLLEMFNLTFRFLWW